MSFDSDGETNDGQAHWPKESTTLPYHLYLKTEDYATTGWLSGSHKDYGIDERGQQCSHC